MTRRRTILLLSILVALAGSAAAELRLALPIGDGMVVQRRTPIPVWGRAAPGGEVTVTLAGRRGATRADGAGRWRLEMPPLAAGGPFELGIESAGETLRVRDLLVGDVWLCSGQSNMEWVVADALNGAAEVAAADDPWIRHFKVPRSWAVASQESLAGGSWEPADPQHVGSFTAVGYFFARRLRPHLDVPIGLINSTWGGSRIEAWMSAPSLGLDAAGVEEVLERERAEAQAVLERLEAVAGELPAEDRGLVDGRALWAAADLDDSGWHWIDVPARWEEAGWEGMDGIGWYRTAFHLTASEAAAGLRLGLGTIDDSDITWVNGQRVGATEMAWSRARVYEVPPGALVAGANVLAVRVEDTGGGGGIYGDEDLLWIEVGGDRRPLAGSWRFQLGAVTLNLEDRKRDVPTMLYNRMIYPLQKVPIRGVLWYQGESNAGPDDAFVYRRQFADMIRDWRRGWGDEELPFLFVQLAAFMAPREEPGDSDWAVLRESQSAALALPATAQVVTIDAGDADDVHPRDKQTVGRRLALAARRVAYGEEVVFSGPRYRGHEVRDGRVLVEFDHVGGGLVAGSGDGRAVGGFAVAGADRRFVRAAAEIHDDRVVVWSDRVERPVAVRYAWADNPEGAELYNREGLPASPFRTDDWEAQRPEPAAPGSQAAAATQPPSTLTPE